MTNEYRIRFGTVGWQYPQWLGDFFPEDLPEEWWLPYYGNEFPVVAVSATTWGDEPAEQIEEWLDNSDEHFRFIFEWSWQDAEDLQAFVQRLQPVRQQTLGILLQLPWSACCQPAELSTVLKAITTNMPVCLEIFENDMTDFRVSLDFDNQDFQLLLQEANVGCCWHGVEPEAEKFFASRELAITKLSTDGLDSQQLRQVIELCSAQIQLHDAMVVLFAGTPPALKPVRDAMVMLELLV